jgi:putative permease
LQLSSARTDKFKLLFFVFVILLLFAILLSLSRIMIPLGIAFVLSLMLKPVLKLFYSTELKKKTLSIIMLLGFLFTFSYPVVKGVQTITDEAHKIEYYLPKLENYLRVQYGKFKGGIKERFNYEITFNPVDKVVELGQETTKSIFVYLPKIIGSLLEWSFIIPLFLFFILKDERRMRFLMLKIVPNSFVEKTYYLYHQFNTKFGDYIFAKFIEAAIVGIVITTGLLLIGFPFAFLLGLIAAITNILPYIGPILGFLPALVVGLADQNPNTTLGAMVLLYLIANIIDLALVFPLLVSKIVNLHPMIVVVSVIIGSQFAGVVGMIVSIPLAAFLKLLFQEFYAELYGRA